jgi:hypothetical protein
MPKSLKFSDSGASQILAGVKNTTWRIRDDKNIAEGDSLLLIRRGDGLPFAEARVVSAEIKQLSELSAADYQADGWEKEDKDAAITMLRKYYGNDVDETSPIKVVKFELVESIKS